MIIIFEKNLEIKKMIIKLKIFNEKFDNFFVVKLELINLTRFCVICKKKHYILECDYLKIYISILKESKYFLKARLIII